MKKSAYIYPNIQTSRLGSNNPYISNLKSALENNGFLVSSNNANSAFADLLTKSFKSDVIFLNWIEDLPERRFGKLQFWLFYLYLYYIKKKKKVVVWIKHNKISHTVKQIKTKEKLQTLLLKKANHIVVHSSDSNINSNKSIFIHHPNQITDIPKSYSDMDNTEIDLLIWGEILPYKGIFEFLSYVRTDEFLQKLNIYIIGNCKSVNYVNKLQSVISPNVTFINQFVDKQELNILFAKTRFILFTYLDVSIMSSGSLVDSLVACKLIIGPNCGSFSDIAKEQGFVKTYKNYTDIGKIVKQNYSNYILPLDLVSLFLKDNTWEKFGNKMHKLLYEDN